MSSSTVHARFKREESARAEGGCPPQWLLDKIADESLNPQGWNQSKANLCPGCFTHKSKSGSCLCS
jgi:hypothetical protein